MKNIKTYSTLNKILIVLIIVLLLGGIGFALYKNRNQTQQRTADQTNQNDINFSGPTEEEKKSGDSAKPSIIAEEEARNQSPTQNSSGKRSVTPIITYGEQQNDQVEVGAYVTGIFEDGGTCTLTLQKGSLRQTVSVDGVKGSNSVNCPVMIIKRDVLGTGSWQAVVSYSSSTSEGQSSARTIEVN